MDTKKDHDTLEAMYLAGDAPWKNWVD
jgi:hypothetical protein